LYQLYPNFTMHLSTGNSQHFSGYRYLNDRMILHEPFVVVEPLHTRPYNVDASRLIPVSSLQPPLLAKSTHSHDSYALSSSQLNDTKCCTRYLLLNLLFIISIMLK
jgi:hypothetical protein